MVTRAHLEDPLKDRRWVCGSGFDMGVWAWCGWVGIGWINGFGWLVGPPPMAK